MELNKIYNENCLETMAKMPDCFVDLVVTSPPYDNLREYKGYSFDFEKIAKELFRVVKDGGVVVWVVGDATENGSETTTSAEQKIFFRKVGFNIHDTMIYERFAANAPGNRYFQNFEYMFVFSKGTPKTVNLLKDRKNRNLKSGGLKKRNKNGELKGPAGNREFGTMGIRGNIWEYSVGGGISSKDDIAFKHPAIFPEDLAADHIYSWSNEGDLIYDCFGGSGTTAKMAHLQKRNWIISELSPEYVKIAEKRLNGYLAQTFLF
jgi:site-specific DNA-methyltransferase (adenine-specific)